DAEPDGCEPPVAVPGPQHRVQDVRCEASQRAPQPAQPTEVGEALPGDRLHRYPELTDAFRPVTACGEHEDRRVDALQIETAQELVELVLVAALAELADHIGHTPRRAHVMASSAPRSSCSAPSSRAVPGGVPGARAACRAGAARARWPRPSPAD